MTRKDLKLGVELAINQGRSEETKICLEFLSLLGKKSNSNFSNTIFDNYCKKLGFDVETSKFI